MPRQIFSTYEELRKWCDEFVEPGKYVIYTTSANELILEPRKSTQPRRYAVFRSIKVKEYAKEISEIYNIPHFELERYEWDVERTPIQG
jgi:hypothetical protein